MDGMALGEMQNSLLKERQEISEEGIIMISLAVDQDLNLLAEPIIESVGFLHMSDAEDLRKELVSAIQGVLAGLPGGGRSDSDKIAHKIRGRIRSVLKRYSRNPPVIKLFVNIIES